MAAIVLSLLSLSVTAQQTWDASKNPTVEAITSKYTDKYISTRPAPTTNDVFPVLGQYESTNPEATSVTITLDAQNKGIVWVEGLPQGKIKAMLRKSPAIYKIPAQKTESGKEVAEGTLIFDKENNSLNIVIGKEFNTVDPAQAFATEEVTEEVSAKTSKTKTKKAAKPKTWLYTGSKLVVDTAVK